MCKILIVNLNSNQKKKTYNSKSCVKDLHKRAEKACGVYFVY